MDKDILNKMRPLCDEFAGWQPDYDALCPFVQPEYEPYPDRYMEMPFMGRALYQFWEITGEEKYKKAANGYLLFFTRWVCEKAPKHHVAYDYGVGLEAACLYAKYNPLKGGNVQIYADLMLRWLRSLKNEQFGVYFLCGYNFPINSKVYEPAEDVGYSDDLCHVGRGLARLYEIDKKESLLEDMRKFAKYFVTDIKDGTLDGIWSPKLGTWAIGQWALTGAENIPDNVFNKSGWVFSAFGDAEFLLDFTTFFKDDDLNSKIYERCIRSIRWIFETCAFENGAVGVAERDDEWVGLASVAVLGVVKLFDFGLLNEETSAFFKPFVAKSWRYVLDNSGENLPVAGYTKVTGKSSPIPGNNVPWVLSWIVLCLARCETIEKILNYSISV